jgi:hypothetical protein
MDHEQLMAHRAKKLAGKTPLERGREKMLFGLFWVYRWGWSSPGLVNLASGSKDKGLAARLVKQGFLKSTTPTGGNLFKRVPSQILTLTPDGVALMQRNIDGSLGTNYTDKYTLLNLQHDYVVQKLSSAAFLENQISDFNTPLQMTGKSMDGIKQPDAIWFSDDYAQIGIEVELDGKWNMRFDQFVHKCIGFAAEQETVDEVTYDRQVRIFVETKALLDRYQHAFKPGRSYDIWRKDIVSKKWFTITKKGIVPDWVNDRIAITIIPAQIWG